MTQTSTRIPFSPRLIDLLFMRFGSIYGHTWSSRHVDETAWRITKDEWSQGLAGIDPKVIRPVLDELRGSGNEFPPSLPAFVKMCRSHSGIPDQEAAFQLALRRNFNHPIIKNAFDQIGSWDFTHDTEKTLRRKFAAAYQLAVNNFFLTGQKLIDSDKP